MGALTAINSTASATTVRTARTRTNPLDVDDGESPFYRLQDCAASDEQQDCAAIDEQKDCAAIKGKQDCAAIEGQQDCAAIDKQEDFWLCQ